MIYPGLFLSVVPFQIKLTLNRHQYRYFCMPAITDFNINTIDMRILKGMMIGLAALFFLGYVNSCDSSAENSNINLQESTKTQQAAK